MDTAEVAKKLKAALTPFFQDLERDQQAIDKNVDSIATLAVHLDMHMVRDNVNYVIDMAEPKTREKGGFPFESQSGNMRHIFWAARFVPPTGSTVGFVVTPLLRAFGNTFGHNYDQSRVMDPMRVVVEADLLRRKYAEEAPEAGEAGLEVGAHDVADPGTVEGPAPDVPRQSNEAADGG